MDGIGDAIDGTVEEIADFLYNRLLLQGKEEVRLVKRKITQQFSI